MVIEAYLSAAGTVAELLRSPALADAWSAPSALAEFRVSGLAGHLGRGVQEDLHDRTCQTVVRRTGTLSRDSITGTSYASCLIIASTGR